MFNIENLMKYLEKAEGNEIHYNEGESDITSMYGIYRRAHPNEEIFKEIDKIAKRIGIYKPSKRWTKGDLDKINAYVKDSYETKYRLRELAKSFYKKYVNNLHLELFEEEIQPLAFSIAVTSTKCLWKATQQTLNTLVSDSIINYKIQIADGIFGRNTKNGLEVFQRTCRASNNRKLMVKLFESRLILFAEKYYIDLVASDYYSKLKLKDSDIKSLKVRYLRGWSNRILDFI